MEKETPIAQPQPEVSVADPDEGLYLTMSEEDIEYWSNIVDEFDENLKAGKIRWLSLDQVWESLGKLRESFSEDFSE